MNTEIDKRRTTPEEATRNFRPHVYEPWSKQNQWCAVCGLPEDAPFHRETA